MHLFILLPSSSSSLLGRLDYAELSQQTLMEMLIDGITNKAKICGSTEDPEDITSWPDVVFNDTNEVIRISWAGIGLRGRLALQWTPPTVTSLLVVQNALIGTADITSLPPLMKSLTLTENEFDGSFYLQHLPNAMKSVVASDNYLSPRILSQYHSKHSRARQSSEFTDG